MNESALKRLLRVDVPEAEGLVVTAQCGERGSGWEGAKDRCSSKSKHCKSISDTLDTPLFDGSQEMRQSSCVLAIIPIILCQLRQVIWHLFLCYNVAVVYAIL